MPRQPGFLRQVGPELLKRRWWIMAGIGLIALLLEVNERIQLHDMVLDFSFFLEAFMEGVVVPVLGGVLLSVVDRATQDRYQALELLTRKQVLTQAIENARNWNDLLKIIVESPRAAVPLVGSVLLVYQPSENQFVPEAFWGLEFTPQLINTYRSPNICDLCPLNRASTPTRLGRCEERWLGRGESTRYCLPLVRAGQVIALLHLYQPDQAAFTEGQKRTLEDLAVEMATAIDEAQKKRLSTLQKERADAELRRITRDLHDNLAQNLIYVRHKLDQLADENTLSEISALRSDLTRMREVVDDAYIDVRNILKELEANVSADLSLMLQDYARTIDDRTRVHLQFSSSGKPQPIPTRTARQVLSIFVEILVNIEKHAGADRAHVDLAWKEDSLTLTVADNGHGFNSNGGSVSNGNGHMGLNIMRERAKEMHGRLTIHSAIGKGTEISLWLPINQEIKNLAYAKGAIV